MAQWWLISDPVYIGEQGNSYISQWRHDESDGVSTHRRLRCLLNCCVRHRSKKKTLKLRITGLCAGNSPVTDEFPAHKASNAENVSIWWRHHELYLNEHSVSTRNPSTLSWQYPSHKIYIPYFIIHNGTNPITFSSRCYVTRRLWFATSPLLT